MEPPPRFHVPFYLVAMIFLLFDIEVTKEVQQRRRLELLQEMTSALSRALTMEEVARIAPQTGGAAAVREAA